MINNLLTQDIQVNTCKSYIVKKVYLKNLWRQLRTRQVHNYLRLLEEHLQSDR